MKMIIKITLNFLDMMKICFPLTILFIEWQCILYHETGCATPAQQNCSQIKVNQTALESKGVLH